MLIMVVPDKCLLPINLTTISKKILSSVSLTDLSRETFLKMTWDLLGFTLAAMLSVPWDVCQVGGLGKYSGPKHEIKNILDVKPTPESSSLGYAPPTCFSIQA